jgi:hypothetical protein
MQETIIKDGVKWILKSKIKIILLVFSIIGIAVCSAVILFQPVRQFIISIVEQVILHHSLQNHLWNKFLIYDAMAGICLMIFVDLFMIIERPLDVLIFRKAPPCFPTNEEMTTESGTFVDPPKHLKIWETDRAFLFFVCFTGLFVLLITIFRAQYTGITYDEAFTYLNYVFPGFTTYLFGFNTHFLNDHVLNSLLARLACFATNTQYNEFVIRLPNVLAYIAYIFFACSVVKTKKYRYFFFLLFIGNYYLNEFFGLARGYGIATACIAGALYFFEKWKVTHGHIIYFHLFMVFCSLAALANQITLYVILGMLILIVFKYRYNIIRFSNIIYFLIFVLMGLYCIWASRTGMPIGSSSFYFGIIDSIPSMFSRLIPLKACIFVGFIGILLFGMLKTRGKSDYGLIFLIFVGICTFGLVVFHRRYPIKREMIPLYPVIVLTIIDAIKYLPSKKIVTSIITLIGIVLCFQFTVKIDLKSTSAWGGDYSIREEIYAYALHNNITETKGIQFKTFIDRYDNPAAQFYKEKIELFFESNR